jgi:hypothetical protein
VIRFDDSLCLLMLAFDVLDSVQKARRAMRF